LFDFRKDRDYEKEQIQNPTTFIYQSMHYVIKLKTSINFENVDLPTSIFCEVQIRTLLQHAYSELTHDTIYKPKTKADPKTHRLVARSMALIETTDSIFVEVGNQINFDISRNEIIINSIQDTFNDKLSFQYEKKINQIILDVYSEIIPDQNEIINFVDQKNYILERIIEKAPQKQIYRQPVIVILYYLVFKRPNMALKLWPFTQDEILPIYSDLGISLPTL
jgi:putative GTP pyrophosphokinase